MTIRSFALFCCFVLYIIGINAQSTKKVSGAYTYHAPENISLEEAKHIAVNRAKIAAISDAFGTLITQNNFTIVSNNNEKSAHPIKSVASLPKYQRYTIEKERYVPNSTQLASKCLKLGVE